MHVKNLFAYVAVAAGDAFEVDYVRVYDIVRTGK